MRPPLRKFVLTLHVASSVGLLGAVAAFLVLALAGQAADPETARGAYLAMELITSWVIVPLAAAALLVGIAESLGTKWGLVRHYWIVAKLALTLFAIIVLLLQLDTIGYLAQASATQLPHLTAARGTLVLHSAGGLIVLLLPMALSIYKPRGRLPTARRKSVPAT